MRVTVVNVRSGPWARLGIVLRSVLVAALRARACVATRAREAERRVGEGAVIGRLERVGVPA
jgi:hypothetical protein